MRISGGSKSAPYRLAAMAVVFVALTGVIALRAIDDRRNVVTRLWTIPANDPDIADAARPHQKRRGIVGVRTRLSYLHLSARQNPRPKPLGGGHQSPHLLCEGRDELVMSVELRLGDCPALWARQVPKDDHRERRWRHLDLYEYQAFVVWSKTRAGLFPWLPVTRR
jgi:hypothetical protein